MSERPARRATGGGWLLALCLGASPVGAVAPPSDGGGAPRARPAPTRPGLSWEAADAFARKVALVERRFREGRSPASPPVELTEAELNSYINLTIVARLPPGVTGLEARFVPGRIAIRGSVDLDRVREGLGILSPWNPLRLVSGITPVAADAALHAEAGIGRVSPQEASLGVMPIPASVLATIVAQVTRTAKQPAGVDILAPFPLPYGIQRIRLRQGRARIEF